MKLLPFIVTYLFFYTACFAQEGFLKYVVKAQVFDPQARESMQKMSDPAVQAQLKAMQEQMKSPEMQEMMKQNPQLKAQMEMMAGLSNGENVMDKILPKSMEISFNNGNSLVKIEGGFSTEILYLKSNNESYQINRKEKNYKVIESSKNTNKTPKQKAVKTTETQIILGYTCTKYIVTNSAEKQIIWATTQITNLDFSKIGSFDSNSSGMPEGVEGIPLKFEISSKEMNIVFEAIEFQKSVSKDVEFALPAGFTKI